MIKKSRINMFVKSTNIHLKKKIIFDLDAISQSPSANENEIGLKMTNILSEETCDDILVKIQEKYGFDDREIFVAITVILQRGGTNKSAANEARYVANERNFTAQDLQKIISIVKKNATNRQFARAMANEIAQVAIQLNIEGDLANQMRFEYPDLDSAEAAWCSNFQTTNPKCPEKIRNWLVKNYKDRFKR